MPQTVSHGAHGVSDINTEIISPENSRFVLHDSMVFEPGETQAPTKPYGTDVPSIHEMQQKVREKLGCEPCLWQLRAVFHLSLAEAPPAGVTIGYKKQAHQTPKLRRALLHLAGHAFELKCLELIFRGVNGAEVKSATDMHEVFDGGGVATFYVLCYPLHCRVRRMFMLLKSMQNGVLHAQSIISLHPRTVRLGRSLGETKNLDLVKNFLHSRGDGVDLKDRVHAVWLCAEIPRAGGRVFETGDEILLKLGLTGKCLLTPDHEVQCIQTISTVPVVVVFTKFDNLVNREMLENMTDDEMEMEDDEVQALAIQRADLSFEDLCVKKLHGLGHNIAYTKCLALVKPDYRHTLANLIDITQNLVSNQDEGEVWLVSAMAQRASAQAKIDSSIKVGMKRKFSNVRPISGMLCLTSIVVLQGYWQGLASSAHFKGYRLDTCLNTIHSEITSGWNFNDPDKSLSGSYSQSIDGINNLIGITSAVASTVAPVTVAVGLSVVFVQWIARIYQRTPAALRCLMGHIIDLTLVMDLLFLQILALTPPRRLTWEQVETALDEYRITTLQKVHQQIRDYANTSSFAQTLATNNVQEKIVALISQYRSG
ncbi:hypothetical protein HWV62_3769 [Athelia sp. TMB]|nr:hypothetical protein HWV62_3769 [Athelia sp. TMB]